MKTMFMGRSLSECLYCGIQRKGTAVMKASSTPHVRTHGQGLKGEQKDKTYPETKNRSPRKTQITRM